MATIDYKNFSADLESKVPTSFSITIDALNKLKKISEEIGCNRSVLIEEMIQLNYEEFLNFRKLIKLKKR